MLTGMSVSQSVQITINLTQFILALLGDPYY